MGCVGENKERPKGTEVEGEGLSPDKGRAGSTGGEG